MSVRRVVIDLELTVDDGVFKAAALTTEPSGVADVSDPAVRDAVAWLLVRFDWSSIGAVPLRSIVTPRRRRRGGWYDAVHLPLDRGVAAAAP